MRQENFQKIFCGTRATFATFAACATFWGEMWQIRHMRHILRGNVANVANGAKMGYATFSPQNVARHFYKLKT